MADGKWKIGEEGRVRVAGEQGYEVEYLMQKTKISAEQARDLIKQYGNDRATLVREAKKLGR